MYTPQHQPSNALTNTLSKYTTDDYLVNELQFQNNLQDIEYKKNRYEYIEITDEQVAELRNECHNEMSRGDAIAVILAKHWKDYKGLVNQDGLDEDDEASASLESADSMQTVSESSTVKVRKKIVDAVYDHEVGTSYYFIAN